MVTSCVQVKSSDPTFFIFRNFSSQTTQQIFPSERGHPSSWIFHNSMNANQIIWVTQGKTDHLAQLKEPLTEAENGEVLIEWSSTGASEYVPVSSVRLEIGRRRRANGRCAPNETGTESRNESNKLAKPTSKRATAAKKVTTTTKAGRESRQPNKKPSGRKRGRSDTAIQPKEGSQSDPSVADETNNEAQLAVPTVITQAKMFRQSPQNVGGTQLSTALLELALPSQWTGMKNGVGKIQISGRGASIGPRADGSSYSSAQDSFGIDGKDTIECGSTRSKEQGKRKFNSYVNGGGSKSINSNNDVADPTASIERKTTSPDFADAPTLAQSTNRSTLAESALENTDPLQKSSEDDGKDLVVDAGTNWGVATSKLAPNENDDPSDCAKEHPPADFTCQEESDSNRNDNPGFDIDGSEGDKIQPFNDGANLADDTVHLVDTSGPSIETVHQDNKSTQPPRDSDHQESRDMSVSSTDREGAGKTQIRINYTLRDLSIGGCKKNCSEKQHFREEHEVSAPGSAKQSTLVESELDTLTTGALPRLVDESDTDATQSVVTAAAKGAVERVAERSAQQKQHPTGSGLAARLQSPDDELSSHRSSASVVLRLEFETGEARRPQQDHHSQDDGETKKASGGLHLSSVEAKAPSSSPSPNSLELEVDNQKEKKGVERPSDRHSEWRPNNVVQAPSASDAPPIDASSSTSQPSTHLKAERINYGLPQTNHPVIEKGKGQSGALFEPPPNSTVDVQQNGLEKPQEKWSPCPLSFETTSLPKAIIFQPGEEPGRSSSSRGTQQSLARSKSREELSVSFNLSSLPRSPPQESHLSESFSQHSKKLTRSEALAGVTCPTMIIPRTVQWSPVQLPSSIEDTGAASESEKKIRRHPPNDNSEAFSAEVSVRDSSNVSWSGSRAEHGALSRPSSINMDNGGGENEGERCGLTSPKMTPFPTKDVNATTVNTGVSGVQTMETPPAVRLAVTFKRPRGRPPKETIEGMCTANQDQSGELNKLRGAQDMIVPTKQLVASTFSNGNNAVPKVSAHLEEEQQKPPPKRQKMGKKSTKSRLQELVDYKKFVFNQPAKRGMPFQPLEQPSGYLGQVKPGCINKDNWNSMFGC